jgi:hypothetical protein
LDDIQRIALHASFARFFSEAATAPAMKESFVAGFGDSQKRTNEEPYRYRRFSGGRDLPPGRYYAVCQNPLGFDGGVLAAELASYVDPAVSGPVHVCDSSDPMFFPVFHRFRSDNSSFYPHALAVTFLRRRGWASPAFAELQKSSRLQFGPTLPFGSSPDDQCTVYFPLRVEKVTLDPVIDLRWPQIRRWLADRLFKGIPTARYLYRQHYEAGEDLSRLARHELFIDCNAEQAAANAESRKDQQPYPADRQVFVHATQPTGANNRLEAPSPELNDAILLRLLTFTGEGGSPITDAIGEWLRELGADALIYPSARMNARVHMEDGRIIGFTGFNLVDYRDAPRPRRRLRIIQKPASYIDWLHLKYPVAGPPPSQPRLAGSFELKGVIEAANRVRVLFEELAWQRKQFGHRDQAEPSRSDDPRLSKPTGSIFEVRSSLQTGIFSLSDSPEVIAGLIEKPPEANIGSWLVRYINEVRAAERSANNPGLRWIGEWFFFSPHRPGAERREYSITCPVCEHDAVWSAASMPPPQQCEYCGFSQPTRGTPNELQHLYVQSYSLYANEI